MGRCKGQICGEGLCELANEQPASRICILDYSCPGIIWRSWLCRVTNILSVMDLELYISSCNALGSYSTNSTYHSCILIYCKGMLCPTCPYQPKCRCVYMYNCRGGAHGIQQEKLHTPVYPSLRLYCMRPTSQPKLKIYCLPVVKHYVPQNLQILEICTCASSRKDRLRCPKEFCTSY